MSTFQQHLQRMFILVAVFLLPMTTSLRAQQLPDPHFEDWSGSKFDGKEQLRNWNASNVEQLSFKFNFAHKEAGRSGYCMMVQDQDVGAAGITETSPGYFSLGQPWVYLESLTKISEATAGTAGGISWNHRPDSMSVWIKRTGSNIDKEDFYLLYYAWSGTAVGNKFKGKNGKCTSVTKQDEESDVRYELDGNECGTVTKANQIAEGMWRERRQYGNWTNIRVPIYYFNSDAPTKMNIIFSASNYPNYRANSGLYAGNSLYVDDVELIYSSKIQKLFIKGKDGVEKEWKGFDPNSTEVQVYSLGETATTIPDIVATRGAGSLTNARGKTVAFSGRVLSGSEITITKGDLESTPTRILVKAEDGSSQTLYQIQFQRAPSSNASLAEVAVNGETYSAFRPGQTNYNIELPYGTTAAPVIGYTAAEDGQVVTVTQATSPTGTATIHVTAPDGVSTMTYTLSFFVGQLKDVTLQDIKVNGKSIIGFTPSQAVYKVSLPVGTPSLTVEPVSAYPAGEQTITITPNPLPTGEAINGTTVQVVVAAPGATSTKTYKLNIKIEESSYSYLADLQVVGEQVSDINPSVFNDPTILAFDPEVTTYYVNLKMGTKELPYILYTPGDEYQTITIDEGGLDGTTRISVLAGNRSDQTVYKLVFSTAKSEISTLSGLEIGGVPVVGFASDVTNYTYELPIGTTVLPEITPIPGDEFQEISVTLGGVNGKTRISVTAGNGNTTNYYITFSVKRYDDNTLKSLSVGPYYSLQDENYHPIAFDPLRNDYYVKLEKDSLPTVHFELQNEEYQDTVVIRPTSANGKYKITVRPTNGLSRTYTIQFVYKKSDNTALQMIYVNDTIKGVVTPLPDFAPDKIDYTFTLDTGTTVMPDVIYDLSEPSQVVTKTWDANNKRVVRLSVVAESGAKRTYKIKFMVPSAASTQLDSILLVEGNDTILLPGFKKDVYEYTYPLTTETCPKILAVKAVEDQQVTITAPYAAGIATILVKMEESTSQYTIDFVKAPVATVQLSDILINGVSLEGFVPTQLNYTGLTYRDQLPTVEGIASNATVELRWKENTAYLNVHDEAGSKVIYSLAFTRELSGDNTLEGIYADGVLINGFAKSQLNYTFDLPAGSAYPVLKYEVAQNAEVVFFGQVAEGKWAVVVSAENGEKQTYTVQYNIAKYSDATLVNMELAGFSLSPAFDSNTFEYAVTIDEGASLPKLTVETRPGQTILQNNANDTLQQVIVFAENGASNTYSVRYTRQLSSNALLADILINGVSLEGFDPTVENYIDSLPRNTQVVPNVFPIGQLSNQTITTYFSRPNGVTRIHVEAQNGTEKDYRIAFPVRQSNNTFLGDLYLDSEDAEIKFKPATTDYEVILPYEATECPKMVYEKAEPEQRIDVVSRPIGQTSQIIVTAENGDTRTYNIAFKRSVLKTRNILAAIHINELDRDLSLKDKDQRDFNVEMPFGSRSLTVEYEKSYPEQTVFVQPGGVTDPTIITVKANNDSVADEVYRIIPSVEKNNPAVITSMTLNGVSLSGFNPYKYSYIVPVENKHIIRYTVNKGADINVLEQNEKHWQAEVSYGSIVTTYDLWFYYTNDVLPNTDFADWENAAYKGRKPVGWNTLGNVTAGKSFTLVGTYTTGNEVTQDGSNSAVKMETKYNAFPLGGFVPAYITLGNISYDFSVAAGSDFGVSGGITFRNSPDIFRVTYKQPSVSGNGRIVYQMTGSLSTQEIVYPTSKQTSYTTVDIDLMETNELAGIPQSLNVILNSYETESGKNGLEAGSATMYVDKALFLFNHTLVSMKVDEVTATKSGNTFTATLTDPERVELPVLSFTGEVADQAQDVVWAAPTKDADFEIRTADIRNWAENGVDYTDYTLTVKRPLDEVNVLSALLAAGDTLNIFNPATTSYTITIPSSQRNLPDLQPIPGSSLQHVTTAYSETDSTMTITVTPEKGDAKVYTVKFVTALSNDVTLKALTAEGITYKPDQKTYDITATRLPLISFEKQSDLQTVVLNNGVLTVTAEDGVTTGTYTINRLDPVITPNGTISEFEQKGNVLNDFGGTTYEKEAAKPTDYITFTREQATDSVIFVQASDKMTWAVPETENIYTWSYPTDESTNANLKMITINGEDYQDFIPSELNYELTTDSTMVIVAEPAEEVQKLVTTFELVDGGVLYSTLVTAQSGAQQTYRVRITHPKSDIATLSAIYLDSLLIDGFAPDKFSYTVTLPAASGAKLVQPKMPNITYVAGQAGQTIIVTPGKLNGDETTIAVQSEDKNADTEYTISIRAQKSSCADLTGITVNGVALDHFEPGRHHYSVSLATNDINVDYTSDDRFQTVTTTVQTLKAGHEYHYTLHVVAEDGTASDYLVEIYVDNQSNDAQLANILLNGRSMDRFEPLYNSDIIFDGGNNNYEIKLPATTKMPEVSAQLKMDGQHVEIEHRRDEHMNIDSILLDVTAVDSVTHNIYVLRFIRPMSTNSQLSLIEINNEPIADFEPNTYFYSYDVKSGEEMPRITVETADEAATYDEPDYSHEGRITITVYAQDYAMDKNHKSTYTIAVNVKKSDVATLDMIYQGRDSLPGFKPTTFYYAYELGADETFPDLSWQDPDNYPTVSPIDTVEYDPVAQKLVRQIKVTAEDTTISNTYTVAYTIKKSDVDTLQMIFIGSKPLPNFKANIMEYEYKLTAAEVVALDGELPEIDPIPGEEGKQKIEVLQVRDNYGVKTIGYKHVVTVTAAAGNSRTYTVHYPRELSDDATLKMIFVDENPLPNFDAERNSYKIELDYGVPVPNVTEAAKEFQSVKHNQHGDTVEIIVTAELETVQNVYTLVFERRKSDVTMLRNIILLDAKGKQLPYDLFAFQSKLYDYTIEMPYVPGDTTYALPEMAIEFEDPLQDTVITVDILKKTQKIVTVRVIAPNGEDEAEYKLFFDFLRNDDAFLTEIKMAVNDSTFALIKGFKSNTYSYIYEHPYGSDSSQFISSANVKEKIAYAKSDPLATDSIYVEANGTIRIVVTAQDEKTQSMYSIQQKIGKDTVDFIKMIYLDGVELPNFRPDSMDYVYKLRNGSGSCPEITAVAMSGNAEVSITQKSVNETSFVICQSDRDKNTENYRTYRIYFEESTVNDGITATERDVFIRRVAGACQLFVATIRKDVTFILYDQTGRMLYREMIPDAEPNAIKVEQDGFDQDVLLNVDVDPNAGVLVDINPNQIYFYSFVKGRGKIIKSGKIIALP